MKIFDIEFQIPSGQPKYTLHGNKMDIKIYDNGGQTAVAVCSLAQGVNKAEGFAEHSLSEIICECKKINLDLSAIVFW